MVHFEVIQSPDQNVRNSFKYHKNQVYLGADSGDLFIKDPLLNSSHLMLEVVENDLLVHPQKDVPYYLINGKRATSIHKVRAQDTLTIGKTTLKILSFEESKILSKKEVLDQKMNKLLEENSPLLSVIEKLTKLTK